MDATANPTWIGGGVSAILAAQKCTQDLVQADQRAKLAMQKQPVGETPAAPSSRGDASGSDKRKEAVQQRLLLLQEDWEGQMREARAQHADLLNSGEQSSRAGTFLPQTAQQADQRTEFSGNDPLGLREPEPDDLLPAVIEHAVQHCIRPKGVQLVGLQREGVQIVGEVGDVASMRAAQAQALLEQQAQLTKLAERAAQTLSVAKRHGRVTLVTNAEHGWIELSCQKFMPTLYPSLENVKILSARSTYEQQGVASPFEWKYLAFENEISGFYEAVGADCLKNVISFGDSAHEREALIRATENIDNCRTKSLKFVERPEVEQLMKQHDLINHCFPHIVNHDGNLDLCIRCS
jgi:hypothetical protein